MKKISIITIAKVASSSFLYSTMYKYNVEHGHSLLRLKNILENENNTLIIVGIRNPIDRNLSYLFQTYKDNFYNDVKTKINNYQGEYCYIKELAIMSNKELNKYYIDNIIELYFRMSYHNTFNEWFDEFFEITKINEKYFNCD